MTEKMLIFYDFSTLCYNNYICNWFDRKIWFAFDLKENFVKLNTTHSAEITEFYCHYHLFSKIPWNQLFAKELYSRLIWRKKFAWQLISRFYTLCHNLIVFKLTEKFVEFNTATSFAFDLTENFVITTWVPFGLIEKFVKLCR